MQQSFGDLPRRFSRKAACPLRRRIAWRNFCLKPISWGTTRTRSEERRV